jgi:pSer/pThr/pTyr-binding forkhead associated (FHA) protein
MPMLLTLSMADPQATWVCHPLPEVKAFLIGRHPDCAFILEHASVSRHHAKFSLLGHTWSIEDLHSRNGTYRNGLRTKRAELHEGDILHIGDWAVVLSKHDTTNLNSMTSWLGRVKAKAIELGLQIFIANKEPAPTLPLSAPPAVPATPITPTPPAKNRPSKVLATKSHHSKKITHSPKTSRQKLPITRAKPSLMLNPGKQGNIARHYKLIKPSEASTNSGLKRLKPPPTPR